MQATLSSHRRRIFLLTIRASFLLSAVVVVLCVMLCSCRFSFSISMCARVYVVVSALHPNPHETRLMKSSFFPGEVPSCSSSPCHNGATCFNEGDKFSCDCREGFTGKRCEISESLPRSRKKACFVNRLSFRRRQIAELGSNGRLSRNLAN